jgi:antitoxin ParD1/3/4
MTDLSFSLPSLLQSWIDQRVAEGRYNDAGEYLRDLIRRDQETNAEDTAWLRAMVEAGRNSGMIDAEPEDVIEDIIRERRARRG